MSNVTKIRPLREPISSYCTLMTIEEFKSDVADGALIDYDGFGYMSDGKFEFTEWEVVPSDVERRPRVFTDPRFSFVAWYNR